MCSTRARNKLKYALVFRLRACRTRCQPSATRSERTERTLVLIAAMIQHPQQRNRSLWGGGCVMRRPQPSAQRRKERKYVKYINTTQHQEVSRRVGGMSCSSTETAHRPSEHDGAGDDEPEGRRRLVQLPLQPRALLPPENLAERGVLQAVRSTHHSAKFRVNSE